MFSTRVVASLVRQSLRRTTALPVRMARRQVLQATAVAIPSRALAFSTAAAPDTMFCRQCEQTENHVACTTTQGICGKTAATSAAQDALLESVKSLSAWCQAARQQGIDEDQLKEANVLTLQAVFSTLTNVNFDEARICDYLQQLERCKAELKTLVFTPPTEPVGALDWRKHDTPAAVTAIGQTVSVPKREAAAVSADAFSLNEIASYGLKGVCAYAAHCYQLGKMDAVVMAEIHRLYALISKPDMDVPDLLPAVLKVGEINASVLAMLDQAHAEHFGVPEPTQYRTTAVEGKCILVSGHDMLDLYELLKQTEGTGINVYTHGEMLPAHAYPKLKAFKHLAGNYGTAWQNQKFEFAAFPGPIIVTTNCLMEPRRMYQDRIYTMNEVGWSGISHIGAERDYTAVIEQAQQMKGFPKTIEPAHFRTAGFNHRVLLPMADQIIEAVQKGVISRILLIGGCDGSQYERSYFTDLAEEAPDDSLILTLGCAKNRIIHSKKLDGATLSNGLPRVLDMGQCNDSYSAVGECLFV
uniref:Hydroxylamine reductase n=1 Tax=Amphora coffeiformis TaxID=265554 RepID=A0A7S3LIF4_9STRA